MSNDVEKKSGKPFLPFVLLWKFKGHITLEVTKVGSNNQFIAIYGNVEGHFEEILNIGC